MPDNPVPPLGGEDNAALLDWCQQAVKEGDAFLRAQKGYEKIADSIDAVMGAGDEGLAGKLSRVRSNRLGKINSDLVSLLTDTKPFFEYKVANPRYEKNQDITGKLATAWYYNRAMGMRLGDAIRYWSVGGSSYCHMTYNPDIQDIDMTAEDPRDVLPIRPSGYESIQGALGVIIRRERTVNYVQALFPEKAHLIVADREGGAETEGGGPTARLMKNMGMSPFEQRLWGDKPAREMARLPVVDLFTTYVRDDRRNESGYPVRIGQFDEAGEPLNNWSYTVQSGEVLYPRKRCIQFTRTAVLYNSTSIYWHGLFPLAKLSLDPVPWSWLGRAPMWDLLSLQGMYDKTLRVIEDLLAKFAQPDVIADKMSISKAALQAINTRQAGVKFHQNGMAGKGIALQYPQVAAFDLAFRTLEMLREEMDTVSGVRDMSQLMKLGQLPGADTIEKITETMSPSVRGRSRVLEAFVTEFAGMLAFNLAQFYTMSRRLVMLGADGITPEDFDYDPGTFIPDYVHPGDYDNRGIPTREAIERGPLPRFDRAKEFMRQMSFHVEPASLLASSEIDRKLMYLQLSRAGLIDHWTLLKVLGIPNVGEPPSGANSITDRLMAEQQMALGMEASAAGRKATGQTMPRMVIKES